MRITALMLSTGWYGYNPYSDTYSWVMYRQDSLSKARSFLPISARCYMLANDLTLNNAVTGTTVFRLTNQLSDGSRRIDVASSLALPSTLTIKHSLTGKSPAIIDRHLISLSKTVAAAIGSATMTANFTLAIPRDAAITALIIHDVIANFLDFLNDGAVTTYSNTLNVDAVLRGES